MCSAPNSVSAQKCWADKNRLILAHSWSHKGCRLGPRSKNALMCIAPTEKHLFGAHFPLPQGDWQPQQGWEQLCTVLLVPLCIWRQDKEKSGEKSSVFPPLCCSGQLLPLRQRVTVLIPPTEEQKPRWWLPTSSNLQPGEVTAPQRGGHGPVVYCNSKCGSCPLTPFQAVPSQAATRSCQDSRMG